jgi:hypothetical protein
LIPNITLRERAPPDEFAEPLGRYARMRQVYLREHCPIQYSRLILTEQLFPHARKVDEEAHRRLEAIMSDILVFQPPPDKSKDSLSWAAHMTAIKELAERMVLDEIVYV